MRSLFRSFTGAGAHSRRREAAREAGQDANRLIVVGLGNPGPEHAGNRHNVGFWTVNRLARKAGLSFTRRGRLAHVAEGQIDGTNVVLAKPQTYVNRSGEAVRELLKRYKAPPERLVVVYDELDLPLGALRIRERGSHGGQNGMRSIISAIGSQDFPRIRIGIGRPVAAGEPTRDPEHVARYVLSDPPASERKELDGAVANAVEAIEQIIHKGAGGAMAQFNSVRE